MLRKIYQAGRDFAENQMNNFVARFLDPQGKAPEGERQQSAAMLSMAFGGAAYTVGIVGLTFSIMAGVGAVLAPGVLAGVATAAVVGAGFATMALFGQGMLRQGEEVTRLMATSRTFRKGILAAAVDDVKNRFKPRAAAPAFDKAATPEAAAPEAAPEAAAKPAAPAPKL